jgi:hypothetical protein
VIMKRVFSPSIYSAIEKVDIKSVDKMENLPMLWQDFGIIKEVSPIHYVGILSRDFGHDFVNYLLNDFQYLVSTIALTEKRSSLFPKIEKIEDEELVTEVVNYVHNYKDQIIWG